jgi:hypothetical protein
VEDGLRVSDWSVRDEIIRVTHYWPLPVIAFIIGSLVGWGLAYILPPSYRAEVTLFVAYDDARECRNPDDCKNWQLEQIDALARSQIVLQPTLDELKKIDSYWNDVSTRELAEMLDVLWRNAGQWRMVAIGNDAERSKTAVEVWSRAYLDEYQAAQEHSLNIVDLNARIRALNLAKVQLERKLSLLNMVINEVAEYQNSLADENQNEQLAELTRWELINFAAQASSNNLAWRDLIENFPGEMALISDYLTWLDRLAISIDQEIESIQIQLDQLGLEIKDTLDQIAVEADKSHALSRTVEVSKMVGAEPQVVASHRNTTFAVLGGIIGLLIWGLVWVAFPIWRSTK